MFESFVGIWSYVTLLLRMPGLLILAKKHWFLIGVLGSIFLAEIFPSFGASGGPLKPEWTVKYFAVALVFFLSGLSLTPNEIVSAVIKIKVHAFVQVFTFILVPIFVLIINIILEYSLSLNEWILKGLATLSCMPPPISSAVIFTRAVGGNEAIAVFNSVVGSFIGLLVTPLALFIILGTTAVVSVINSITILIETVLVPLGLGQLLRAAGFFTFFMKRIPIAVENISTVGQLTLLFIIYTTFCDVFRSYDIPMNASDVLITVVLVLLIQMVTLYGSFKAAIHMKCIYYYSPEEIVAMMFCSTHKSLTLGIPILRILFSGYAHFSQITLPLLLYHPTQIILGGLLVPYLKKWLFTARNETRLLP